MYTTLSSFEEEWDKKVLQTDRHQWKITDDCDLQFIFQKVFFNFRWHKYLQFYSHKKILKEMAFCLRGLISQFIANNGNMKM